MRKMLAKSLIIIPLLAILSFHISTGETGGVNQEQHQVKKVLPDNPYNGELATQWVDSVFGSLSEVDRIAQLFMVAAYSNKNQEHVDEITELIKKYKIGGLIFFQGGPIRQAILTNKYQSLAETPLLVSIDAEWGLAMRLDSTVKYSRQMMLGAIQDDALIYQMGADIAEQCKRLGIHVNLAPVIDVNNNPKNPVINSRSFGEDKYNVARKGIAYMKGMQDNNILANAKHFPGHGDTDVDSHKGLPVIKHSKYRLDNLELYPFKALIKEGIGSMMVAHLSIPTLDSTPNLASTLSKPIVTGLLEEELGFKGLIFTDALNMKGVSAYYKPGEVDVKALIAGNDVMLFSQDVPTAIKKFRKAISRGEITQKEIDERCKKILQAKYWCGLDKDPIIELENLYEDLNQYKYPALNRKLVENSITLLTNKNDLIPLKSLDTFRIASLAIGVDQFNQFQKTMDKYAVIEHFNIKNDASENDRDWMIQQLDSFDVVIVGLHGMSQSPGRKFGIKPETVELISALRERPNKLILSVFGNPYSLGALYGIDNGEGLLMCYQDNDLIQDVAAQAIFGGVTVSGKLPVSASTVFELGNGMDIKESIRFKYASPEAIGLKTEDLERIDAIVAEGISKKAFPGCQVLVAKEGVVVYNKVFGHHTYKEKRAVKEDDLYDLASITKIASTTMTLMRMMDEYGLSLDQNLCDYIPELVDTTEYQNLNFRLMLAHHSGLASWIPFYVQTLIKGMPRYDVYSMAKSEMYPQRVADKLYINKDYEDEIYKRILATSLRKKRIYRYSDLGYYFFKKIIEKEVKMPVNEYVQETFYKPLGLTTMGFLPRNRFELDRIVPTEYDMSFRKQLIHGDVHDPGAAMMGGVGGHAGLFANANDLAKIMQLLINEGEYGGSRFLSRESIKEFTRCQFCDVDSIENRRGAGFDKPVRDGVGGPTCQCISYDSFGHSGFTGTLAWADPDEKIVYIFLSNRIYPNADNRKLIKMGTRTKIMQAIYDAVNNTGDTLVKRSE